MNQNEKEIDREAEEDRLEQEKIRSATNRSLSVIATGAISRAAGRYLPRF